MGIEFINIRETENILLKIKNKNLSQIKTHVLYFLKYHSKNNRILNFQDPIYLMKAIKSKQEIKNIKIAHIYMGFP